MGGLCGFIYLFGTIYKYRVTGGIGYFGRGDILQRQTRINRSVPRDAGDRLIALYR